MNSSQILRLQLVVALLSCSVLPATYGTPRPVSECSFHAFGTTVPNTSGSPAVIDNTTGTVVSANFFNSGAIINSPHFDGNEFVSVCVVDPILNDPVIAEISTDVGLQNDAIIKAYPEFIFGSKFGNLFETSFRFYPNSGLPPEHQWPVTATNTATSSNPDIDGQPFTFANLEYVSQVKGIGLPAYTNNLPQIDITLDTSEENVVGAERDVMLESWFYDTSANAALIGNNTATDQPIANTLNNIVGAGHPHYDQLNNVLLEMMVHIGPLSKNDVSKATRNPGKYQLTEIYSGKDFDGDGIDDHFDVDSHTNVNSSQEPQPGKYSSGIDANGDGIDDADILPITIGDYQYSIWYGTTHISPLVIYSRETDSSLTSNFDPAIPDTNLTTEGEINLNWNLFLDHTLYEIQSLLQLPGVENAPWASGPNNLFDNMRASGGAIGGLEIGVEPQINDTTDSPYTLKFETLDVLVDGVQLGVGINAKVPVYCNGLPVTVNLQNGQAPTPGDDVILGTPAADSIDAMGGNDTICGLDGNDDINGGPGNDWIDAGNGDDTIQGADDNDEIYGGAGVDFIYGGLADDVIYADEGDDFIWGNSGNDTIYGGIGVDNISGGSGNDEIHTGPGGNVGTSIVIRGGAGNDVIFGSADADEIRGETGDDTISGGDGNDRLFGGGGKDLIYGEAGDDLIKGNAAADILSGGTGNDQIDGLGGNDLLHGDEGSDSITGSTGSDTLYGDTGDDNLHGGGGNDLLDGGSGNDSCNGAGGNGDTDVDCESATNVP